MTGGRGTGRRRARPLTRAERTAKRRRYEQPMWLPQPWRWMWVRLLRPVLTVVLRIVDAVLDAVP